MIRPETSESWWNIGQGTARLERTYSCPIYTSVIEDLDINPRRKREYDYEV